MYARSNLCPYNNVCQIPTCAPITMYARSNLCPYNNVCQIQPEPLAKSVTNSVAMTLAEQLLSVTEGLIAHRVYLCKYVQGSPYG